MSDKYEITNISKVVDGTTVYRIRALKSFNDITTGDLGGFIENTSNLSQRGKCWIYDDACVFGLARVVDNAAVYETVEISDNIRVCGYAQVFIEKPLVTKFAVNVDCRGLF